MHVRKIDTTHKTDVRQFIGLPFELYKECPQWVPPILPEMRKALDRKKHPFYRHSAADFFVVEHRGQILARIMVMDNHNYNRFHDRKDSFFYFYDAIQDVEPTRMIVDAALEWAGQRKLDRLIGPKGLLPAGDGLGLLVDGFQYLPALNMPYNYPYYDRLLKDCGFEKETDYLSGFLAGTHQLSQRFFDLAERVKARRGLWIKSFANIREARRWIHAVGRVYNASFVENWEYCPITDEELDLLADQLSTIVDPHLVKLVMKDDQIVGFILAYPDISKALQRTGGRIWPLGWITLLREFKRTRVCNLNGTGLLKQYQGLGANTLLYTEVARSIHSSNFERAEVVQVEEQNTKSLGDMAAIGVTWHKRHRIYRHAV